MLEPFAKRTAEAGAAFQRVLGEGFDLAQPTGFATLRAAFAVLGLTGLGMPPAFRFSSCSPLRPLASLRAAAGRCAGRGIRTPEGIEPRDLQSRAFGRFAIPAKMHISMIQY